MLKRWIARNSKGRERLTQAYETYADECRRTQKKNIEK